MVRTRLRTLAILAALLLQSALQPAFAEDFYIAPDGRAEADGSRSNPWDLEAAFSHPGAVKPGDTLWLRGGLYSPRQTVVSTLIGSEAQPVVVRQYPGERATIDCARIVDSGSGDCFRIEGRHAWYWGFEVMNSSATRRTLQAGSAADPRGLGIHSQGGPGTRLINLVIHDVGTSLFESQPSGIEIYGVIAYNSGWDAPDRSHGPGFYIRNRSSFPRKKIQDNVVFQHFRQGLQGFGSFDNVFSNFLVEGNVLFNNGIGAEGFHRNLMFGNENTEHRNNVFRGNYTYFTAGAGAGANTLASESGGCSGLVLADNVFAHGPQRVAVDINHCADVAVSGNLFFGRTLLTRPGGPRSLAASSFRKEFTANVYFGDDLPAPRGVSAFVRRNRYEPRRAHVIVYNWDRADAVAVEVSRLHLPRGARYEIRNVQDYFGRAIKGSYDGAVLVLPMTGWSVAPPIGYEEKPLPPTFPEFGVFVLNWERDVPAHLPRGRLQGRETSAAPR